MHTDEYLFLTQERVCQTSGQKEVMGVMLECAGMNIGIPRASWRKGPLE